MTTYRALQPTVYLPLVDVAAARRALRSWLAAGVVPVAHIVAEPDPGDERANDGAVAG